MSALPSWNRYPGRFTIIFGAIALLLFVLEHINGRFWLNDFRVYYGAGEAILKGDPIYGVAHGLDSGVFKYAPVLALVYALFAMLPYGVAASVQYLLITLAFIDGLRRIDRLVRLNLLPGKAEAYLPLFLIALACIVHLHRELHLGNINMMLLWLLIVTLEHLLRGRDALGGILLGAAILAKPHFFILAPLLVLHGKWRGLSGATAMLIAGVVLPALMLGWEVNMQVHGAWLTEMAKHNAALIYTGGDDYRAVNTIYSFAHRAILKYFVAANAMEAYALLMLIAAAFAAFVLWNKKRSAKQAFTLEFLVLVALVPSLTLTDTEHFLFTVPLVAYLFHRLVPKTDPRWLVFPALPLLLCYGGNFEDALGPFSDVLIHHGVLGIGSFGLIVLSAFVWSRSNQRTATASNRS
jgi:hypothetical protein